ncbi:MAG: hypothetical protein E7190_06695 [Erysipelotrichaceae bacterium]|nr:hypothetical protein [Erysipelotrichaceae bacterium]
MNTNEFNPKVRYWIPEGMCEEDALRRDIQSLAGRGFSGVELVFQNLLNLPVPLQRQYGSDHMTAMLKVILDEVQKHHMRADLANGFQWPISAESIDSADDDAASYELTYGCTVLHNPKEKVIPLPPRVTVRNEGTSVLIAVSAYRLNQDGKLILASFKDLSAYTDGTSMNIPADVPEGEWVIFAFYAQPSAEKVCGRYYVINHFNQAGALACFKDWNKLFEKLGKEYTDVIDSFFCDSLEYHTAREWTKDFLPVFEERKQYSLLPYLPVLGFERTYPANELTGYHLDQTEAEEKANRDYAETLTWMFCERHLKTLTECAHMLGKTVRYQVAYNKPLQEELCALYPDIPENESLGRVSLDNLRLMSCAAHLERKRYSYEVCAEYMNAYGQSQKDILWWLKRAWICGVNAQVFHGASYSGEYEGEGNADGWIAGTVWPGYEAFGKMVSNYWNRTLSETSMRNLLCTAGRINRIASKRHPVDLLFLRDAYLNDGKSSDEDHIVKDSGLLSRLGYTYEFIAPKMLDHPSCKAENGRLDPQGSAYQALIVMNSQTPDTYTSRRLKELEAQGLPVLFCSSYEDLINQLEERNIMPDVKWEKESVLSAHYCYDETDYYVLYNGNRCIFDSSANAFAPESVCPSLDLSALESKRTVCLLKAEDGRIPAVYDPVSERKIPLPFEKEGNRYRIRPEFDPDEMIIVCFMNAMDQEDAERNNYEEMPVSFTKAEFHELKAPEKGRFEDCRYVEKKEASPAESLMFDDLFGIADNTAGYAVYSCILPHADDEVELLMGNVNDAVEIRVNDRDVPVIPQFCTKADLTGCLSEEENRMEIRVYSNLGNMMQKKKQRYGIGGPVLLRRKKRSGK